MKQFKTTLEKAAKLSRAFNMELTTVDEMITELDDELTRREKSKVSKDTENEFNWLQVSRHVINVASFIHYIFVLYVLYCTWYSVVQKCH